MCGCPTPLEVQAKALTEAHAKLTAMTNDYLEGEEENRQLREMLWQICNRIGCLCMTPEEKARAGEVFPCADRDGPCMVCRAKKFLAGGGK